MDASIGKKRKTRKRSAPQPDEDHPSAIMETGAEPAMREPDGQYDMNEPTMGEKLADLSLLGDAERHDPAQEDPPREVKPPSADSVYLLLRQALRAEDHALLLNCLYTRDEQVIRNSVSSLNPSDALRLLDSLISMLQSRGAVLVCCIPWLRSLLVQHASSIISQPSSPAILNSLYQLIDSRVSTFGSALRLSACLDSIFAGVPDLDDGDEEEEVKPVIFEDRDSEEEGTAESGDEQDDEDLGAVIDFPHGANGGDAMLDSGGEEEEEEEEEDDDDDDI